VSDCIKLPVFVIIPRVRRLDGIDELEHIEAEYRTGGTFNDAMIIQYLERIVIPYMLRKKFASILLLIDQAKCHMTDIVKNFCNTKRIVLVFIPPRMTNLLQPADVGWFGSFKKLLKKRWDEWFIQDVHTYTVANNMRSPGYVACCIWIQEIWESYECEEIRKSFKYCGIQRHQISNEKVSIDTSQLHSV